MVEKETKHSINVTFDQHEAIINLKRGRDTVYDVVDRLLEQNADLCHIEDRLDELGRAIVRASEVTRTLKKEMQKWES